MQSGSPRYAPRAVRMSDRPWRIFPNPYPIFCPYGKSWPIRLRWPDSKPTPADRYPTSPPLPVPFRAPMQYEHKRCNSVRSPRRSQGRVRDLTHLVRYRIAEIERIFRNVQRHPGIVKTRNEQVVQPVTTNHGKATRASRKPPADRVSPSPVRLGPMYRIVRRAGLYSFAARRRRNT